MIPRSYYSIQGLLLLAIVLALGIVRPGLASDIPLADSVGQLRVKQGLPACGVAVIHAESMELAVVGETRMGSGIPVDEYCFFALASQVKAMTGLLIVQLVDKGVLSWDTTVEESFPNFAERITPDYRGLTLAELIAHEGGIVAANGNGEDRWTWDRLRILGTNSKTARLVFAELLLTGGRPHPLRGEYHYSNAGYAIATAMAEQATGKEWWWMQAADVGQPLKLGGYRGWPMHACSNQPYPHILVDGVFKPNDVRGSPTPMVIECGGGLSMPFRDYARFVQHCLIGLKGGGCYPADTLARLEDHQYFAGWLHVKLDNREWYEHAGALSAGAYAYTVIIPEEDIAVAVVVNAYSEKANAAVTAFAQGIAGLGGD